MPWDQAVSDLVVYGERGSRVSFSCPVEDLPATPSLRASHFARQVAALVGEWESSQGIQASIKLRRYLALLPDPAGVIPGPLGH